MARSLRKSRNRKVVSRKPKEGNLQKRFTNPKRIKDDALRSRYDKKKTLKQNLESTNVKEMYSDKLPDKIPKKARHIPKVNEEEAPICQQLVKKHGNDYERMHWDVKLNIFQWTTGVCKKKVQAWKDGRQRSMSAEILSGHGMDLRKPLFGKAKERNVFGH
mmetsp:Transcript_95018/g.245470  ORF Transcript_95018/g.245470 Transcript_95018/m.245470 type:complete len:161 (-) Transcript_95018:101-583(-)